jgi:hypothetical protein
MKVQSIAAMGVAALAMTFWATLRMSRQHQLSRQASAKPAPLLTWEGEGGALPDGSPCAETVSGADGDTGAGTGAGTSAVSGANTPQRG